MLTQDESSPDWWQWQQQLEAQEQSQFNSTREDTTMKAGAMIESKFMKKEDLDYDNGNLVTITKIDQQNVGANDGEEDLKWIIHFREFKKGMVLNSTNIQLITKALGTDETEDWIGQKVVAYVDDNVSFGGKLVGGIRIRKVRGQAAQNTPAQSAPNQTTRNVTGPSGRSFDQEMDIDIPF